MDPQACWDELIDLIKRYHELTEQGAQNFIRSEIVDHLENLAEWIDKGGFIPTV